MGYSVAVPVRSPRLLAEMTLFMEQHFRPWSVVAKGTALEVPYDWCALRTQAHGARSLSYDHGKCRIGFNYGGGCLVWSWPFCACAWMAWRVGRRRQHHAAIPGLWPYLRYDGHETFAVVPLGMDCSGARPSVGAMAVDEHGWHPVEAERPSEHLRALAADSDVKLAAHVRDMDAEADLIDQLVKAEVYRLDELWLAR